MVMPIAEKTLAHPTDPMCWDEIPAGKCELDFRPPSAFELSRTPIELGMQLTKTCLVVNGLSWLIYWVVLPRFDLSRNPFTLIVAVTGCLMSALVLFANPRLTMKRKWPTLRVALAMPAGLVVGGWLYHVVGFDVTVIGCLLYCCLAVALMWRVCQKLNCHTAFWLTADFEGNEKRQWRKACLLYTSPSPRDKRQSRMPSSA